MLNDSHPSVTITPGDWMPSSGLFGQPKAYTQICKHTHDIKINKTFKKS